MADGFAVRQRVIGWGVDVDVLHLLGVHVLNPVNGGVVQRVRPVFCLGEGAEVLARQAERAR